VLPNENVAPLYSISYTRAMQRAMTPVRLRLKELREGKGWSQTELARRSGVLQGTISKMESGATGGVDFEILEKLADALGINAAVLIAHEPKRRK
jgi:transcriptional regulator with XRE-family HTH domain